MCCFTLENIFIKVNLCLAWVDECGTTEDFADGDLVFIVTGYFHPVRLRIKPTTATQNADNEFLTHSHFVRVFPPSNNVPQ